MGWPGTTNLDVAKSIPGPGVHSDMELSADHFLPVEIDEEEVDIFYNKCCNSFIWPVLHSMPDSAAIFTSHPWEVYTKVNQTYAAKALEALEKQLRKRPGQTTVVWFHDYHLFLAPTYLRQMLTELKTKYLKTEVRIAFFLHVPFPSYDSFSIFPWAEDILEGILNCDLVGFHTHDFCQNFMDTCRRLLGCTLSIKDQVVEKIDGDIVKVQCFPISIPFDTFERMASNAPVKQLRTKSGEIIVLGVDRLDYTKGIVHKLLAFGHFLSENPEYHHKIVLIQVAAPSRSDVVEYQDLKTEVEALVGEINGQFGSETWTPIRYINRKVSQQDICSLYRDSDIMLITPLRDGMNLVAKEYVACQVSDPGILLLSQFAGASVKMDEAILVNPYTPEEMAKVLLRACKMTKGEREARMEALRTRERTNDIYAWMDAFFEALISLDDLQANYKSQQEISFKLAVDKLIAGKRKFALLLDFDGTLTPLVAHPDLSELSPKANRVLNRLLHNENVEVAIISGRPMDELEAKVGKAGIIYSGCHGNEIKYPDGRVVREQISSPERMNMFERILQRYLKEQYQGSWIESKAYSICVHLKLLTPPEKEEAKKMVEEQANGEYFLMTRSSHLISLFLKNKVWRPILVMTASSASLRAWLTREWLVSRSWRSCTDHTGPRTWRWFTSATTPPTKMPWLL